MERLTDIEVIAGQAHPVPKLEMQNPSGFEKIVCRLSDIENILGDTYDLDRLRELVEADKDERIAILSEPMKPMVYKPNDTDVYCPKCGETLSGGWELSDADDGRKMVQCPKCGQAIDDTKCQLAAESALAKEVDQ